MSVFSFCDKNFTGRVKDVLTSDYEFLFFNSYEWKNFLIWTIIGGVLQILCQQYMKAHPELFEEEPGKIEKGEPETKFRKRRFFVLLTRGGALVSLPHIIKAIKIISKYGSGAGALSGFFKNLLDVRNRKGLQKVSPSYWFEETQKAQAVLIHALDNISRNSCGSNNDMRYLLEILKSEDGPFEERKRVLEEILDKYFTGTKFSNGKEKAAFLAFLLCLIAILSILFSHNIASYHLILANLLKALREGKISKPVVRLIIRKLRKKNILIDPALITEIESSV